LLGKSPLAYLLVGVSVAVVVLGWAVSDLPTQLRGDPTPLLWAPRCIWAAAVLFGLLLGGCAALTTEFGRCRGVAAGFSLGLLLSGLHLIRSAIFAAAVAGVGLDPSAIFSS